MESYTKIIISLSILILIFLILKLKDLLTPNEERFLKAAENGADVNIKNNYGKTDLDFNDAEEIKELLKKA